MRLQQVVALVLLGLPVYLCLTARCQTPAVPVQPATGSISGRVMKGDQPAGGIPVLISHTPNESESLVEFWGQGTPPTKVVTDSAGRYTCKGLAPGSYDIAISAPTFANQISGSEHVLLADGDAIENIDFVVVVGGIITGRVTSAEAHPLIDYVVSLTRLDDAGNRTERPLLGSDGGPGETDDRGVYRIFAVAPGKYKVSVTTHSPYLGAPGARRSPPPTFYPSSTKEEEGAIVEVRAGAELTGIDIKAAPPPRGFRVTGRVVDDAGGSVAHALISIDSISETVSGEDGRFRVDGVTAGNYQAKATFPAQDQADYYSEPTSFDVHATDVNGVELRAHKANSLSGVVVIEGDDPDQKTGGSLSSVLILADHIREDTDKYFDVSYWSTKPAADGSFHFKGLKPGKIAIVLSPYTSGLAISHLEINGKPMIGTIKLGAGDQMSAVKIVLSRANCAINGKIEVTGGGKLPATGLEVRVSRVRDPQSLADPADDDPFHFGKRSAEVSPDGKFRVENLPPGTYGVSLDGVRKSVSGGGDDQTVTLSSGSEVQVTFTYTPPPTKPAADKNR